MTQRQINYAMAVAGRVSRKHNPPDPYSRIDLFQEIMSRIIKYAKAHPHLTETGWIGYKINWIVVDIINDWRGAPQVEYNPFADTRATIDEYPMYVEEIMSLMSPAQKFYAVAKASGYGPQEIPAVGRIHMAKVADKLREVGYEV